MSYLDPSVNLPFSHYEPTALFAIKICRWKHYENQENNYIYDNNFNCS